MMGPRPIPSGDQRPPLDPTRIDLTIDGGGVDPSTDPLRVRFDGIAVHGNTPFEVPFISHVVGNLYQGGCTNGLVLPTFIRHVVSLYPWESYTVPTVDGKPCATVDEVRMYDDSTGPDHGSVLGLARMVHRYCQDGPTLVHCQAGLNRSGLIAGAALVVAGYSPDDAIHLLRSNRSPAVLCNRTFEAFLRGFQP